MQMLKEFDGRDKIQRVYKKKDLSVLKELADYICIFKNRSHVSVTTRS